MTQEKKIKPKAAKKTSKKKKAVKEEVVQQPRAPLEPEIQPKAEEPKPAKPAPLFKPKREKLPGGPRYYGTGRRKEAVAKVWVSSGSGDIKVNGKQMSEYFCGRKLLEYQVKRPLAVTNTSGSYDVHVEAFGGGVPGQAVAASMGIARALLSVSPDFRIKLKREGLLRRDPRMKERKKYGHKRARKSFQYTKR